MSSKIRLPSVEVAEILNLAAKGIAKTAIAKQVRVAPSTVYRVVKEFPLWEWVWQHSK